MFGKASACVMTFFWMHCLNNMQMTQKILEAEGEGDPVQLDFFLKGNLALEKNSRRKPHSWLPDQVSFSTTVDCPINVLVLWPQVCQHVNAACSPSCPCIVKATKLHIKMTFTAQCSRRLAA